MDIKEKWGIDGFNAVIGNPPYNSSGNIGTGNVIWHEFTKMSLNKFLHHDGYLLYVHPSGWRKPCNKNAQFKNLFKLMCKSNTMVYLSIHSSKDGKQLFKCRPIKCFLL